MSQILKEGLFLNKKKLYFKIGSERKRSQFASRVYLTHLGLCVMWRTMKYIAKVAN